MTFWLILIAFVATFLLSELLTPRPAGGKCPSPKPKDLDDANPWRFPE